MKRISIAEQTLKKQITYLRQLRDHAFAAKRDVDTKITLLDVQINHMEDEMTSLENQRKASSIRNTPSKIRAI